MTTTEQEGQRREKREGESIKDVTVTVTDDDDNEIVFEGTTVTAGEHSVSMSERGTKVFKVQARDGTDGHGDGYDQ